MHEPDDNTLLRQYAEQNSEAAFAALVARHVDKVYSVALRHTRNAHAAEEITQAVFVILAKKSGRLGGKVILAGWLYETARLTALTFIRSEIRRARREQEAYMQTALNETTSEVWPHIAPLLDDALAGLSAADRHAVVLRYFDGKSLGEVGAALGASEGAAKKRVTRAVEKLRRFFTKRGVTLTVTVLTAAISADSVQAAPLGLAATVTAAAAKGTLISATITALVKGTMKTMTWLKIKFAVGVSVAALIAGGAASVAISQTDGGNDLKAQEIIEQAKSAMSMSMKYEADSVGSPATTVVYQKALTNGTVASRTETSSGGDTIIDLVCDGRHYRLYPSAHSAIEMSFVKQYGQEQSVNPLAQVLSSTAELKGLTTHGGKACFQVQTRIAPLNSNLVATIQSKIKNAISVPDACLYLIETNTYHVLQMTILNADPKYGGIEFKDFETLPELPADFFTVPPDYAIEKPKSLDQYTKATFKNIALAHKPQNIPKGYAFDPETRRIVKVDPKTGGFIPLTKSSSVAKSPSFSFKVCILSVLAIPVVWLLIVVIMKKKPQSSHRKHT